VNRRIDFYDDPEAPAANSLVPSVNVVVTNAVSDIEPRVSGRLVQPVLFAGLRHRGGRLGADRTTDHPH
jgi:hypothetical protein